MNIIHKSKKDFKIVFPVWSGIAIYFAYGFFLIFYNWGWLLIGIRAFILAFVYQVIYKRLQINYTEGGRKYFVLVSPGCRTAFLKDINENAGKIGVRIHNRFLHYNELL